MEDIKFLLDLISIRTECTTKEGYEEAASLIKEKLSDMGLSVKIYDGEEVAKDGKPRPNVVAKLDLKADKTILLNAHYDVVPAGKGWSKDPFKPIIEENVVYGRGASDDKSGITAIIWAIDELGEKAKRNVILAFTCDEEVGGRAGLGYLMREVGIRADEALIVDGGFDAIYVGASGIVAGKIGVKGVQGHAGYPHLAKNPIYPLAKAIVKLEEYSRLREKKLSKLKSPPGSPHPYVWGRFSVTMLRAGEKSNVIPGEAEATFDLRLIPEEDVNEAIEDLKNYLTEVSNEIGWKVELLKYEGGGNYYTEITHPFVVGFSKAVERVVGKRLEYAAELGGNDGRYTKEKGIPTLVFGPIARDSRFHGVDEFVRIKDVRMVKEVILRYLKEEAI